MPMPQGTRLRIQANKKSAAVAPDAKKTVALAKAKEMAEQHARLMAVLGTLSESKLQGSRKEMADLIAAVKKGEPLTNEAKTRKLVSELVGEVRKVLEKAKDAKEFQAEIRQPKEVVLRAPSQYVHASSSLPLLIALLQIVECLIRLMKDKKKKK